MEDEGTCNKRYKMNKEKALYSVFVFVFLAICGLQAQSDVVPAGGDASGAGGSVAYSVGQVAYTNITGEAGSINLGVQQPNLFLMVGTNEAAITIDAIAYPNPVNDFVNLELGDQLTLNGIDHLSYGLYDINGKLILQKDITTNATPISMENLSNAIYFLRVIHNNTEIKTFKIFKTN